MDISVKIQNIQINCYNINNAMNVPAMSTGGQEYEYAVIIIYHAARWPKSWPFSDHNTKIF